jgi:hypothetical protein
MSPAKATPYRRRDRVGLAGHLGPRVAAVITVWFGTERSVCLARVGHR